MSATLSAPRRLGILASLLWFAVGSVALQRGLVDGDAHWEVTYMVFSVLLSVAAITTVAVVVESTRAARGMLASIGKGIAILGALSTVIAWATPLWMSLLGLGFAVLAVAVTEARRTLATLAFAEAFGLSVMVAGSVAGVGREDGYGDHPAAIGIGITVTAAVTSMALVGWWSSRYPSGPGV